MAFCHAIRQQNRTSHLPMVPVTGTSDIRGPYSTRFRNGKKIPGLPPQKKTVFWCRQRHQKTVADPASRQFFSELQNNFRFSLQEVVLTGHLARSSGSVPCFLHWGRNHPFLGCVFFQIGDATLDGLQVSSDHLCLVPEGIQLIPRIYRRTLNQISTITAPRPSSRAESEPSSIPGHGAES